MRKPASQPMKEMSWKPKPISEFEEAERMIVRFLTINDRAYADVTYYNNGSLAIQYAYCSIQGSSLHCSWFAHEGITALRQKLSELTKTF